ncbi:MAG: nicotinate-nucleotide--dimethylbenzimidazole phosphoribosyltransferase, partial [Cytophagaceae bacterium]
MSTWNITLPDTALTAAIQHRIDTKTKPLGALGQLETLARQLALAQRGRE